MGYILPKEWSLHQTQGSSITYEAPVLRHFTAEFALLDPPRQQALPNTG
jgi:hypothetical protein